MLFRYGKVETVKLLPQKHGSTGLAAFIDFYDIEAAKDARNDDIKIKVHWYTLCNRLVISVSSTHMQGNDVRTNYKSVRPETKEGKEHSRRYYNSPDIRNDRYTTLTTQLLLSIHDGYGIV